MNRFSIFVMLLAMVLSTSCATMLSGTYQSITIDSRPKGADIIIDGKKVGNTPAKVTVKRDAADLIEGGKMLTLDLSGYQRAGYEVAANVNPIAIINMVNFPFWAIDIATGAVVRYDKYSEFELIPESGHTNGDTNGETNNSAGKKEDKYDRLSKLNKLLEEGAITEEEYKKEKAKILDSGKE